jgi:hypothetical protein
MFRPDTGPPFAVLVLPNVCLIGPPSAMGVGVLWVAAASPILMSTV